MHYFTVPENDRNSITDELKPGEKSPFAHRVGNSDICTRLDIDRLHSSTELSLDGYTHYLATYTFKVYTNAIHHNVSPISAGRTDVPLGPPFYGSLT